MDDSVVIQVDNVSKNFKLPHEKTQTIKSAIVNFYSRNKKYEIQKALKNVSFEVKKGEFFGIVGKNGSGKSTLLKILAGIYRPTEGAINIKGKLIPFIELGVGFSPELSGRENVYLNGALLGFSRNEMNKMYDDIVSFAELERFMDQKLKNYSSGMQVRLAFSIAIRAQGDILVLDEVLAVGDLDFQQKCFDYFSELREKSRTVILVTHDMGSVLKFCDRAMFLDTGTIQKIGKPKLIADAYVEKNYEKKIEKNSKNTKVAHISSVELTQDGKNITNYNTGDYCYITLYFSNPELMKIHFGFQIFSNEGTYCFGTNSKIEGMKPVGTSKGSVSLKIKLDLVPGQYTITTATMGENGIKIYDYKPNSSSFMIRRTVQTEGVANLKQEWINTNV